jgi:cell division protein FtsB
MHFLNSKIFTAIIAVFSVWILFSVVSVEMEKSEVKKEEDNIKAKIGDVTQDNKQLEKFIENFDNPEFLKKEARLRLNYKAPDEEVVFVHRDLNSKKVSSAGEFLEDNLPNYKKWWYYLLGH